MGGENITSNILVRGKSWWNDTLFINILFQCHCSENICHDMYMHIKKNSRASQCLSDVLCCLPGKAKQHIDNLQVIRSNPLKYLIYVLTFVFNLFFVKIKYFRQIHGQHNLSLYCSL